MLIANATLLDGASVDVRVGHVIEVVADRIHARPGEEVLDAGGGTVLPGIHDHHVHLRSAAAVRTSVRVGPPTVRTKADLARTLAATPVDDDGWIRAVGYHDSVAGPLDRTLLDEVSPDHPVRVQHRSGAAWTFNSRGIARVGLPRHHDGRVLRGDTVAPIELPRRPFSLRPLSEALARWGVTGVTDATPDYSHVDVENLSAAYRSGELLQRLHCMALPAVNEVRGSTLGPVKRILDDAHLDLDELSRWITECHHAHRPVAIHCVTAAQLIVTIAALRSAGVHPLDRIEHASVVPMDCIADLAELGATVVTQPNFVTERGNEYLVDVPPDEHGDLWRVQSLRRAGVPVAFSTDVPFGSGDPWAAMRAAVTRSPQPGVVLGAAERVTPIEALTMFLGRPDQPSVPRTIATGEPGDLCIVAAPPATVLATLESNLVVATIVDGKKVSEGR